MPRTQSPLAPAKKAVYPHGSIGCWTVTKILVPATYITLAGGRLPDRETRSSPGQSAARVERRRGVMSQFLDNNPGEQEKKKKIQIFITDHCSVVHVIHPSSSIMSFPSHVQLHKLPIRNSQHLFNSTRRLGLGSRHPEFFAIHHRNLTTPSLSRPTTYNNYASMNFLRKLLGDGRMPKSTNSKPSQSKHLPKPTPNPDPPTPQRVFISPTPSPTMPQPKPRSSVSTNGSWKRTPKP